MNVFTHTIWIARSPETVFDFFTDFSQAARWRQYVQSMRRLDDRPLGAGSRLEIVLQIMGERQTIGMEVLACERPGLWRHRTDESDFNGYVEYRFEPDGAGTQVTMRMEAKPKSVYGWLAMPLMLLRRETPYKEQLPQLKKVLEQQDSTLKT